MQLEKVTCINEFLKNNKWSHKNWIQGQIVLKNIFKTLQLIRCSESSIHSRYDFEKSYLPQKGIFFLNILCV